MSIFITRDDQQLLATLCNSSSLQDFAAQHKALHSLSKRCMQTVLPGSGTHGFDSSSEEAEAGCCRWPINWHQLLCFVVLRHYSRSAVPGQNNVTRDFAVASKDQ
jgi:hypothetical protein